MEIMIEAGAHGGNVVFAIASADGNRVSGTIAPAKADAMMRVLFNAIKHARAQMPPDLRNYPDDMEHPDG